MCSTYREGENARAIGWGKFSLIDQEVFEDLCKTRTLSVLIKLKAIGQALASSKNKYGRTSAEDWAFAPSLDTPMQCQETRCLVPRLFHKDHCRERTMSSRRSRDDSRENLTRSLQCRCLHLNKHYTSTPIEILWGMGWGWVRRKLLYAENEFIRI